MHMRTSSVSDNLYFHQVLVLLFPNDLVSQLSGYYILLWINFWVGTNFTMFFFLFIILMLNYFKLVK